PTGHGELETAAVHDEARIALGIDESPAGDRPRTSEVVGGDGGDGGPWAHQDVEDLQATPAACVAELERDRVGSAIVVSRNALEPPAVAGGLEAKPAREHQRRELHGLTIRVRGANRVLVTLPGRGGAGRLAEKARWAVEGLRRARIVP